MRLIKQKQLLQNISSLNIRGTSRLFPGKPDDKVKQNDFYDHRIDVIIHPCLLSDRISNRNNYK